MYRIISDLALEKFTCKGPVYDKKDTFIIVGAGTHFNSDYNTFLRYYLQYMISQKKERQWPHYIVETLHDVYSPTSTKKRALFNKMVADATRKLKADVFDNAALGRDLESYDGRNFGMKFHMMKANILLHYFHNRNSCEGKR